MPLRGRASCIGSTSGTIGAGPRLVKVTKIIGLFDLSLFFALHLGEDCDIRRQFWILCVEICLEGIS